MLITQSSFEVAVRDIEFEDEITLDFETTGLHPYGSDEICGAAVLTSNNTYYFPFRHREGYNLPTECLEIFFKTLLNKKLYGWNSRFDLSFLRKEWSRLDYDVYPPIFGDVMLASHLLNENQANFKLKDTGDRYAQYLGYAEGQASSEQHKLYAYLAERGLDASTMWRAPAEIVGPYAEQDVILTEQLRNFFIPALKRWNMLDLWYELNDYLLVIQRMEETGIQLDLDKLKSVISKCDSEIEECLFPLRQLTELPKFTPNSHEVFRGIINDHLKCLQIEPVYSTKEETLEELFGVVPVEDTLYQILEASVYYRRLVKVCSTYYKNFMNSQIGGILHPETNMLGTVSGRFSGLLLTVPRKNDNRLDPKGRVKQVFQARPGYLLVEADFNMAEIYLAAHFSQAKTMLAMLENGADVHQETGDLIGVNRHIGKTLNFSVQYGIGAAAFKARLRQAQINISEKQAASYLHRYSQIHPEIKNTYYELQQQVQKTGFLRTLGGRVRHFNGHDTWVRQERGAPYKDAFNNLIQGSVSDLTRMAHLKMAQLPSEVHNLLQIHDAVLLEIPENKPHYLKDIQNCMEIYEINGHKLSLPMKAELKIGKNWGELSKWNG